MVNFAFNLNRVTITLPIGKTFDKNNKSYKKALQVAISLYSSIVMREYVTTISIHIVLMNHVHFWLIKRNSERDSTTEQSIQTVVND
jgi:hypothetical protein